MDEFSSLQGRGYELRERIGAGGFGAVYRGYQTNVDRDVAIKVILPFYASDPEFVLRFETEAQLVARLEDAHIVPLYDFWQEPGGSAFLVMRWLPDNLQKAIRKGAWTLEATARFLDQMAGALNVAHEQGIIHRDIKPDNILLDRSGNAFLADFGLAKVLETTTRISEKDKIVGTPPYTSPEQWLVEPVTPQTDIYSLGLVLYEVLTAHKPFQAESSTPLLDWRRLHLTEPLPPLQTHRPELPDGLNSVLQKATAKRPRDRYPDALTMAADFRRVLDSSPKLTPRPTVPAASQSSVSSTESTTVAPVDAPPEDLAELLGCSRLGEIIRREMSFRSRRIYMLTMALVLAGIFAVLLGPLIKTVIVGLFPPPTPTPTPTPLPILYVEIASNPIALQWMQQQIGAFNAKSVQVNQHIVQIQLMASEPDGIDGMDVWQGNAGWSANVHPDAWLAESPAVVDYANATNGLYYQHGAPGVVDTFLVWGIFQQRAALLNPPLDWLTLQQAILKQAWSPVHPAFSLPCKNIAGFAVLVSAAANYHQKATLTASDLSNSQFQNWLKYVVDAVPSFYSLGRRPVLALASNGMSIADFALLPESEWLTYYQKISSNGQIQLVYPAYSLHFDMPLAMWNGPGTSANVQNAIQQFEKYLTTDPAAQQSAVKLGLRPSNFALTTANAPIFASANGILLNPPGQPITMPSANDASILLTWFRGVHPC